MIKYRTGGYKLIEAVEVEKETEKCIWIKFNETSFIHPKQSTYTCYFIAMTTDERIEFNQLRR